MKKVCVALSLVYFLALVARAGEGTAIDPNEQAALSLTAPSAVKVKQKAEISFAIQPEKGWKVSLEAPLSVKLSNAGKVAITKTKLDVKDGKADGKGFVLSTTLEGASTGDDTVKASAVYFLCTAEVCKRFEASREVAVKVN